MELIGGIISVVCVFFSGFFGHIVAHDFCGAAPRLAERLVLHAVALLPKRSRDRYREEWIADLNDCKGVIKKLTWALGIVWCARGLGNRLVDARFAQVTFVCEAPNGRATEVDYVTMALSMAIMGAYHRYRWLSGSKLMKPLARYLIERAGRRAALKNWHIGAPNLKQADQLIMFMRETDPNDVVISVYDDGQLIQKGRLVDRP